MTTESEVDQGIVLCVENGLELLGEKSRREVYSHLVANFGLKKEEIPDKPEVFRKGLDSLFGEKGAEAIERLIVRKVLVRFGLRKQSKITLAEIIEKLKEMTGNPAGGLDNAL
jgi:hypothetical protein